MYRVRRWQHGRRWIKSNCASEREAHNTYCFLSLFLIKSDGSYSPSVM